MILRGLATGSLGCLLSLLLGASGWAGEVETPNPEAAAHPSFSLQQALKLPDWLRFSINYSAEPMANPIGGVAQTSAWIQNTALDLQVGAGLGSDPTDWVELEHWSLNLNVNHVAGDVSYASRIGAFLNPQTLTYPAGFYPTELALERDAGTGWLGARAGIIPINSDFDGTLMTAPILSSYVHSALNNTYNIYAGNIPITPFSTLAARLDLHPFEELDVYYGWFDLKTAIPVITSLGAPVNLTPTQVGDAHILQLNYTPKNGVAATATLPAALLSIGGFTTDFQGEGVYGSATWKSGLRLGLDDRVWIGAAYSPDFSLNQAPSFIGGGVVIQGVVPSRPQDLLILGGSHAGLSSSAPPDYPNRPYEGVLELGYRLQLNPNLNLQPTLQWIFDPSGREEPVPGILTTSVQISLSL